MAYTITSNSPVAGSIAWSGVVIIAPNGVEYPVADGSTSLAYVWFDHTTPTTLKTSATEPALAPGDDIVFLNDNGEAVCVVEEVGLSAGALVGQVSWSAQIGGRPANLAALAGSESVDNALVGVGGNALFDTEFVRHTTTWATWAPSWGNGAGNTGLPFTQGVLAANQRNIVWGQLTGTPGSSTAWEPAASGPSKDYWLPVTPTDRVFCAALAAHLNLGSGGSCVVNVHWYNAAGGYVSESGVASGGTARSTPPAETGDFTRIGGFATAPASARYAALRLRVQMPGSGMGTNPIAWFSDPMLCLVPANQTAWPPYSRGQDSWAGSGVNLCHPRYVTFEEASLPPVSVSNGTATQDAGVGYYGSKSLKLAASAADCGCYLGASSSDYNIPLIPGRKWIYSFLVRCDQASKNGDVYLRLSDGTFIGGGTMTTSATVNSWKRVSGVFDCTAYTTQNMALLRVDNDGGAGVNMWFDGVMIEEKVGPHSYPSAFSMPPNFRNDYTGDMNATYGAAWGSTVTGRPANVAALMGSEAINNAAVVSSDQLVTDTMLANSTAWYVGGSPVFLTSGDATVKDSLNAASAVRLPCITSQYNYVYPEWRTARPGEVYTLQARAYADASANRNLILDIEVQKTDGSYGWVSVGAAPGSCRTTGGTIVRANVTLPAGTYRARPRVLSDNQATPSPGAGYWYVTDFTCTRQTDWGYGLAARPANVAALTGAEAIQNTSITISGGALQGIGGGAGTAVENARAQHNTFTATGTCSISGLTFSKPTGSNVWDSQVYSVNGYTGGALVAFTPNTISYLMAGLNADPTAGASDAGLDYVWYCEGSVLKIYESGVTYGPYGTYDATTRLAIAYDGATVKYFKNGIEQRSVAASAGLTLYFDSSFHAVGASLTLNTFTATVTNLDSLPGAVAWASQISGIPITALTRAAIGSMHSGGFGNVRFVANQLGDGTANDGEIRVLGDTFYHPDGTRRTVTGNTTIYTAWESTVPQDPFFIVWTNAWPITRFGGGNWGDNHEFFAATYNLATGAWTAVDNLGATFAVTVVATDCIVAVGRKWTTSGGIDQLNSLIAVNTNLPADGATVGATWGSNVGGRPANLAALGGAEPIQNVAITVSDQGILTGAGTAAQISNAFAGGLDPQYVWDFDSSTEGWSAGGDTVVATNSGYLKVSPAASNSYIYSPTISVSGVAGRYVRISFRTSWTGAETWTGRCCYSTSGHGYNSGLYYKSFAVPANSTSGPSANTEMTVIELDMWDLTAGGTDYRDSTVTGIEFIFYGSWQGTPMTHVDWIAVGQRNGKLQVETRMMRDGAVTTPKLADGGVTAVKLGAGAAVGNLGYTPKNIAAPVVRAFRDTSNQSISSATWTKVQLNTEETDTHTYFDSGTNYRFLPATAGYYRISWSVGFTVTSGTQFASRLYRNGAAAYMGDNKIMSASSGYAGGSAIVYFNGTTDYVELYGYCVGTSPAVLFSAAAAATYLHIDFIGTP